MKLSVRFLALLSLAAFISTSSPAQPAPAASAQTPTIKSTVDEVLLDIVVRDKKGKPVNDIRPEEVSINDNGAKQSITSFRLVQGKEAVSPAGARTTLDPLRQLRLVTLAFESGMGEADQRLTARKAAIELVKGDQGTNVYYAVVAIQQQLNVLQQFTNDRDALRKAIEIATSGTSPSQLVSESNRIKADLKKTLLQDSGATTGPGVGGDMVTRKMASVMLDMLRMDASISDGTRLTIFGLQSLVKGLQAMPGRKSILYFTWGIYLPTELDVPWRNLISMSNSANVTFYSVSCSGVKTWSQNQGAADQLRSATGDIKNDTTADGGGVSKGQMMASDTAESASRNNTEIPLRDLAESTGGFLVGDSNNLSVPLRQVNEEISSYYEISYNPGITNYDGSFRKLKVDLTGRKDLKVQARSGYFALPPEARTSGLQAFEMPLLKALSEGSTAKEVEFRTGPALLQPRKDGTDVSVLLEVPLRGLQSKADPAKPTLGVHFSLAALIKDNKGEVVQKMSRDRALNVTAEQIKMGNFVEKLTINLPPGSYVLESAVMDREASKIGVQRSEFTIKPSAAGVGISSLISVRSYMPNTKGLDPNEPFQFQGGSITPTLNTAVPAVANSALRLFFTIYADSALVDKPTVEVEFMQNGQSLQKVPLPLPAADAQGRIPYVLTIPAAAIPAGTYEVRATAKQGATSSQSVTVVKIESM